MVNPGINEKTMAALAENPSTSVLGDVKLSRNLWGTFIT